MTSINVQNVNVQEAKTHFSKYLDAVENGQVIVVCRHNKPIAEIRRLANPKQAVPVFGLHDGFGVPASFFEPLPDEILSGFEGQ